MANSSAVIVDHGDLPRGALREYLNATAHDAISVRNQSYLSEVEENPDNFDPEHGVFFTFEGTLYSHIINDRTYHPCEYQFRSYDLAINSWSKVIMDRTVGFVLLKAYSRAANKQWREYLLQKQKTCP
jgi:hypothetical protein